MDKPKNHDESHKEVVVVGGGQAGLAVGYFLARQNRDFVILEAATEPASAWRQRWDSLKLFTPVRYSSLPGLPFPGDPDSYPGRDDVVAYLTDYERHFGLPIELGSRVTSIRGTNSSYDVIVADRTYHADQVVVATGPFQVPFVPPMAENLDSRIIQFHSYEYRSPQDLPNGSILVVGGGNTGFQIAEELSKTREVHLSIGAKQMPLPQRFLGRDVFWYLDRTGLIRKTTASRIGRRMKERDTLVGSTPRALRRRGVKLHGRAESVEGSSVRFVGGEQLEPAAVIWATGFRLDHSWIEAPIFDDAGNVKHRRGVTESPGLFFLGLSWMYTRGSALIGWVKDDAEHIAGLIDRHPRVEIDARHREQDETKMRVGLAVAPPSKGSEDLG